MNKSIYTLLCITISTLTLPAIAADMQKEINHLLAFVESTPCKYERNGTKHTGKEAVEHIKTKYNYFMDDIDSTEKFIELSATKSTTSGNYYMIYCADTSAVKSQQWLLQELNVYRKSH